MRHRPLVVRIGDTITLITRAGFLMVLRTSMDPAQARKLGTSLIAAADAEEGKPCASRITSGVGWPGTRTSSRSCGTST
jgi:ABC-type phosphate/phosphonate transport system substrate-binding protein